MKRSRFTAEQIIGVLREQETGILTADVCGKHEIRRATFYGRKPKFGGLEVSDAKRLRQLEDESTKQKAATDRRHARRCRGQGFAAKKWWRPPPSARLSLISSVPRDKREPGVSRDKDRSEERSLPFPASEE
jgi:putative transposase